MSEVSLCWLGIFPAQLKHALRHTASALQANVFAAGGVVRDILLDRPIRDLDLVVGPDPILFAQRLAEFLRAPMFILDEKERVARIAWEIEIDVSGFRSGSLSIEQDLHCRDFTINAMAFALPKQEEGTGGQSSLIDPCHGLADLENGIVRVVSPSSFAEDPLRLLRAFRLMATLHLSIEAETAKLIVVEKKRIGLSAPERIKYEMDLLFSASNSAEVLIQMQKNGLLFELFPLLRDTEGVSQPLSHHLDVLNHSLAALCRLEEVLADPVKFFPDSPSMVDYPKDNRKKILLKWAALFHDCGKPQSRAEQGSRITFYNHDRNGADLFEEIAAHYRWSRKDTSLVSNLISCHMWPFHLNNVYRQQRISKRACLRLAKRLQENLPGLFLLAMADSLAGEGPEKPEGIEGSLASLYHEIETIYRQELALKMASPPLITGHDLLKLFDLKPGPIFKVILDQIRDAQLCGELDDRRQALSRVRKILADTQAPMGKKGNDHSF